MKKIISISDKYIIDFFKNWRNTTIIISVVLGTTLIGTIAIRKIYFKTVNDLVNEAKKREDEKAERIKLNKINNETLKTSNPEISISDPTTPTEKQGLGLILESSKNKAAQIAYDKASLSSYSLNSRYLKKKNFNTFSSYQINFSIENPSELILFSGEYFKRSLKILEDIKLKRINDLDENKIEVLNDLIEKTKSLIDSIQNFTKNKTIEKVKDEQPENDDATSEKLNSPDGSISSLYSYAFYDVEPNFHFFKLYTNALDNISDCIIPRVNRSSLFNCENLNEFYAKVHCLRNGFEKVFSNQKNCDFFIKIGEYILKVLVTLPKDQEECLKIYNDIIDFILNEDNRKILKEELNHRNIPLCNFYDLVIDYIILDSFEDLENPPSSVVSVVNHRWLSDSFKIKALQTVINIVLKHKRSKLKIDNGFFVRFYNLLEKISPILAWGFFGTDSDLKLKCNFIKQGIFEVVKDYFDFDRVRYTSLNDLVIDILTVTDIRYDDLQNKLSIIL